MSPRLPHHRRTNWRIWFRNNRRALAISLVGAIMCLLSFAWLAYAMSQVDVADYRLRLFMLQHDVMSVTTFGQVTATDFEEGTTVMELRRIE